MDIWTQSRRLRRHPALAPLRQVWAYLRNDWVGEGARMRWRQPKNLFQPYSYTSMNRYPRCFAFAREALGEASDLNLLSFGCATGEEAFTLAQYFPNARVKGIDINARAIAQARKATPPGDAYRIGFPEGSSASSELENSYDAVFAFAVFRDSALEVCPPGCGHLVRFADFHQAISDLARCLKPGGCFSSATRISASLTPRRPRISMSRRRWSLVRMACPDRYMAPTTG